MLRNSALAVTMWTCAPRLQRVVVLLSWLFAGIGLLFFVVRRVDDEPRAHFFWRPPPALQREMWGAIDSKKPVTAATALCSSTGSAKSDSSSFWDQVAVTSQEIGAMHGCDVRTGCVPKSQYTAFVTSGRFIGSYCREWVAWNALQGVHHFYVFDNNHVDEHENLTLILERFVKAGLVTVIPFHGQDFSFQLIDRLEALSAESWCRSPNPSCLHPYSWVAFVDADEFLVVPESQPLDVILRRFWNRGGLAVFTKEMTWNGHFFPPASVMAHYRTAAGLHLPYNSNVKTIVRRACRLKNKGPHYVTVAAPCEVVSERDMPVGSFPDISHKPSFGTIAFHHFNGGSVFHLLQKQARGLWGGKGIRDSFSQYFRYLNPVPDELERATSSDCRIDYLLKVLQSLPPLENSYSVHTAMQEAAVILAEHPEKQLLNRLLNNVSFDQQLYLVSNVDHACRVCDRSAESAFALCIASDPAGLCSVDDASRGIKWVSGAYISSAEQYRIACNICFSKLV